MGKISMKIEVKDEGKGLKERRSEGGEVLKAYNCF